MVKPIRFVAEMIGALLFLFVGGPLVLALVLTIAALGIGVWNVVRGWR